MTTKNIRVECSECGAGGAGSNPPYNCHVCNGESTMLEVGLFKKKVAAEDKYTKAVNEFNERFDIVDGDTEETHIAADDFLCRLLEREGYGELVKKYEELDKWYA